MDEAAAGKAALVGYFAYAREAGRAWGALVLVTLEGDPVDFVYTEPVTLNPVTQRLFGARVDAYLAERVILQPLLEQASGRLSLLCVDDPAVLQRRFGHDVPVAVRAPADAPLRHASWLLEHGPGLDGEGADWWVAASSASTAMAALRAAALAMAPFSVLEPFQQLHAAMAEIREGRA